MDRDLRNHADELALNLHEVSEQDRLGHAGYEGGVFALVVSATGSVLANPQAVNAQALALQTDRNLPSGSFHTVSLNGSPTRLYGARISSGPWTGSTLIVGESMDVQQRSLRRLLLIIVIGGAAGLALALVGAWFLAGKALEPIRQAFQRQQEFVADASHELRTPLTALHSATDLLARHLDEPLSANAELVDDLRQEIARLERLTADLLTLARSDLGELALATCDVDLAALAGDTVRRCTPLAQEHGIRLSITATEPLVMEGDPDRLQQALLILLDNAIKHTPVNGAVQVTAKRQAGEAVVEVSDEGEGIAAEHLARIFDRFYRADAARSNDRGGSGLGLAIAKAVMDAHGGQISVHSAPGQGTTVILRFRLEASYEAPSLASKIGHLAGKMTHAAPRQ